MDKKFQEKYGPWAMVVGASQGLGAAFAENCAMRGLNVVICARRLNKLEEVAAGIREKYGVETRCIVADISKEDCAEGILEGIKDIEVGLMIYNAAIEPGGPFVRIKLEDHLANITGNCITPTKLVWPLSRAMAKRGKGGLFLVSSMAGQGGIANWASYGAGKSYELVLGEGLWYELKKYGVTAATYVVGATETPNFKESQEIHGTGLTGESTVEEVGDITTIPRTPEAVAAYLFDQMEDGPRLYSHPDDKTVSAMMAQMPRADYVNAMSQSTENFFLGGTNELLDEL